MNTIKRVRKANVTDAALILDLTRQAYKKWIPVIGREPRPMIADYETAVKNHLVYIYEEGGSAIGLIEMIAESEYLLIENLAVLPESQGRGIGELLLNYADSVAKGLGMQEVRLYTNEAFVDNVRFYQKRGYSTFRRAQIETGGTSVHMSKAVEKE